jgi:hypothetical protein
MTTEELHERLLAIQGCWDQALAGLEEVSGGLEAIIETPGENDLVAIAKHYGRDPKVFAIGMFDAVIMLKALAVELEHDIARPSLALERLIASAAHKNSSAMGRDDFHRVGRIAGVGLGIGHVDASDDIAFGHLGRFRHGSLYRRDRITMRSQGGNNPRVVDRLEDPGDERVRPDLARQVSPRRGDHLQQRLDERRGILGHQVLLGQPQYHAAAAVASRLHGRERGSCGR